MQPLLEKVLAYNKSLNGFSTLWNSDVVWNKCKNVALLFAIFHEEECTINLWKIVQYLLAWENVINVVFTLASFIRCCITLKEPFKRVVFLGKGQKHGGTFLWKAQHYHNIILFNVCITLLESYSLSYKSVFVRLFTRLVCFFKRM